MKRSGSSPIPLYNTFSEAFRRARHPVDAFGKRQGAIRLDLNEEACFVQLIDERLRELQGRFAACDDDVAGLVPTRFCHYLLLAHLGEGLMVGVAKGTLQVAPREAKEEGGRTGEVALALQRKESLVNAHVTFCLVVRG